MAKVYKKGLVLTVGLAGLLGATFAVEIWNQRKIESPHYVDRACAVCHQVGSPNCAPTDCLLCHSLSDGPIFETLKTDELTLCTSCHDREGNVEVPNAEGKVIKVDLGRSHPWGLVPTATMYPHTLPLGEAGVTCQTCHDVHAMNSSSRMLRLGDDTDFTPLCHDCHPLY